MSIQADLPNGGQSGTPIYDELREDWAGLWANHEVDKALQDKADREMLDNAEPTLADNTQEEENDA